MVAHGYIGEDLGTDLYRKIDVGQGEVTKKLIGKRITGSNARINKTIQAACFKAGSTSKPFLKPGQEFTEDEFAAIESGSYYPIFSKIAVPVGTNGSKLDTDILDCVQQSIARDFSKIKTEVAYEQRTLSRIGSIGIYTDGSLQNSSFDLMKDLERVHAVIFSKDIPYEGTANMSAQSAKNFFSSPQQAFEDMNQGFDLTNRLSRDLADSGWKLIQQGPANDPVGPKGTSLSEICAASGSTIKGLDSGLIDDLQSQTYLGNNTGTQGSGDLNGFTGTGGEYPEYPVSGTPGSGDKNSYNKGFRCTGFFCIDVDFVMYSDTLLGGGKTYAIQSILEQNFKIVTKFAGSSFIQAKHTNNFFQLLLKNLDLPSMAHIGVVVTSLPAPIINLPGDKTPRGKPSQSDAEKQYNELVSGVFTDRGLDIRRSNALPVIASNARDYGINTLEGLTTDQTDAKLRDANESVRSIKNDARSSYVALKEADLKNEYGDSFAGDLNQFEAFTKAFVDHLGNFVSLVQKIDEIPQ